MVWELFFKVEDITSRRVILVCSKLIFKDRSSESEVISGGSKVILELTRKILKR